MSLLTEITRIETAKADIAAAIEEKGVTVPTTTKLDGMAALIASIEAGSGGSSEGNTLTLLAEGTFTPTSNVLVDAYKLEHKCGKIPKAVIVKGPAGSAKAKRLYGIACINVGGSIYSIIVGSQTTASSLYTMAHAGTHTVDTLSWTTESLYFPATPDTYPCFLLNDSYTWKVFG